MHILARRVDHKMVPLIWVLRFIVRWVVIWKAEHTWGVGGDVGEFGNRYRHNWHQLGLLTAKRKWRSQDPNGVSEALNWAGGDIEHVRDTYTGVGRPTRALIAYCAKVFHQSARPCTWMRSEVISGSSHPMQPYLHRSTFRDRTDRTLCSPLQIQNTHHSLAHRGLELASRERRPP